MRHLGEAEAAVAVGVDEVAPGNEAVVQAAEGRHARPYSAAWGTRPPTGRPCAFTPESIRPR